MSVREAVAARIVSICYERRLAFNGLARLAAVPPTTLKNILDGTSKNPGIVTIKKLCDGLDMDLLTFFDSPEFRDLEQEMK